MSITKITIDGTEYELKAIPNKPKEVEKDYEVISYIKDGTIQKTGIIRYSVFENALWDIHSVKLLSTSEIFTLGDTCKKKDGTLEAPIKSFAIPNKESKEIWVRAENETNTKGFGDWLSNIEKVKEKVFPFMTNDDVKIFLGNEFYHVREDFSIVLKMFTSHKDITPRIFSTKDAAEKYVLHNQKLLSVNDVKEQYESSRSFVGTDWLIEKLKSIAKQRIENK